MLPASSLPADSTERSRILRVLEAALAAVDPVAAVRGQVVLQGDQLRIGGQDYDLAHIGRLLVAGAGKAGAPMAAALSGILGSRLERGVVNVKYGHTAGATPWQVRFGGPRALASDMWPRADTGPIAMLEAGHPVPDAAGQAGAEQMLALLQGLTERDLVIVLLSGGGSALMPLPAPGVTLGDLQALTGTLLACGAGITEINAVRKHCSQIQGGQLARLAAPAQVATLILSDVVGTPLDAIASGPTVPDTSSFNDALAVLERYAVLDQTPASIRARLQQGLAGAIPDTPKPGDPLFNRVNNVVIGDNAIAGRAAAAAARQLGWHAQLLTTYLQGEAREVGRVVAGLAQGIATGQSDLLRPACVILGGETTVTLRGSGRGGRNQELALAAAVALDAYRPVTGDLDVTVITLATDGNDGPTPAAGGVVTPFTVAAGAVLGLDAHRFLSDNDSYEFLGALESLVLTGPTNTNVNDLVFVFVA
jgi:glycerate 2-kinase